MVMITPSSSRIPLEALADADRHEPRLARNRERQTQGLGWV